ncbi:MAG: hypothetical protein WCO33_00100 [bacterium]
MPEVSVEGSKSFTKLFYQNLFELGNHFEIRYSSMTYDEFEHEEFREYYAAYAMAGKDFDKFIILFNRKDASVLDRSFVNSGYMERMVSGDLFDQTGEEDNENLFKYYSMKISTAIGIYAIREHMMALYSGKEDSKLYKSAVKLINERSISPESWLPLMQKVVEENPDDAIAPHVLSTMESIIDNDPRKLVASMSVLFSIFHWTGSVLEEAFNPYDKKSCPNIYSCILSLGPSFPILTPEKFETGYRFLLDRKSEFANWAIANKRYNISSASKYISDEMQLYSLLHEAVNLGEEYVDALFRVLPAYCKIQDLYLLQVWGNDYSTKPELCSLIISKIVQFYPNEDIYFLINDFLTPDFLKHGSKDAEENKQLFEELYAKKKSAN